MQIHPHTPSPLSHSSTAFPIQGSQVQAADKQSKLQQAGQFLGRSVTSLGSTLKSGFMSTYNWAKKIGSKIAENNRMVEESLKDPQAFPKPPKQGYTTANIASLKISGIL